jgi:hypothetical protein
MECRHFDQNNGKYRFLIVLRVGVQKLVISSKYQEIGFSRVVVPRGVPLKDLRVVNQLPNIV